MIQKLTERGYTVKENGPIYYTKNMDKTAKWFEDVLGWYAGIDQRNEDGEGIYGCLLPMPVEIFQMTLQTFNGMHSGIPPLRRGCSLLAAQQDMPAIFADALLKYRLWRIQAVRQDAQGQAGIFFLQPFRKPFERLCLTVVLAHILIFVLYEFSPHDQDAGTESVGKASGGHAAGRRGERCPGIGQGSGFRSDI